MHAIDADGLRVCQRLSTTPSEIVYDNIGDSLRHRQRLSKTTSGTIPNNIYADVGGHASQRDTCHVCAAYVAVATLGSVASYAATYALM